MNDFEGWNQKKKRIEEKIVKDKECASCKKWLECKWKPRGTRCLNYEERS